MQESNKPDLDDSLNVTESHDRMLREAAAVSREKHVDEGGREPVSLWIFASCAVIFIFAGLALGNIGSLGSLFDYDQTVKPGYVRLDLSEDGAQGPPPAEALAVYIKKGQKIYSSKCQGCHGGDGKGGPAYPSLAGSEWALGETQRFSMIILGGLMGPSSSGKDYGVMPSQKAGMTAVDLAGVMTYVRNSFGNEAGDVITEEMAAHALKLAEERSDPNQPLSKDELDEKYLAPLEGEPLDPTMMIDPVSLQPVEGAAG
ncbi:c-type cytochrome [Haloferula sp. A504]|uniref:c-type cytochrome n=1 Tax=Haloferula sp. A504 TaxID=3373601 RepID=UPI0031BD187F|nr:c-type cytochrome [Verrucomicrobiaceae bacterium E54]